MKRFLTYSMIFVLLSIAVYYIIVPTYDNAHISLKIQSEKQDEIELFYKGTENHKFEENDSVSQVLGIGRQTIDLFFPPDFSKVRLDLGSNSENEVGISEIILYDKNKYWTWTGEELSELIQENKIKTNDIGSCVVEDGIAKLTFKNGNPYIVLGLTKYNEISEVSIKRMGGALLLAILLTLFIYKFISLRDVIDLFKRVISERRMLLVLAKNDFKVKYAGSYFGTLWAFVQPICTIMIFWFVFQIGFKNAPISNVPYALWLSVGLVPWFYFSDAWNSATNTFIEYSYLVKKIVFKIDILPLVKIISAFFVHVFFVCFIIVLCGINGLLSQVSICGLVYYIFSMTCLLVGLSFITSSLVVFFKDLSQIMGIILQFGMWLTPIMWSADILPYKFLKFFKLNPMYYIVNGYRLCILGDTNMFPSIGMTIYFWLITIFLFLSGISLFARLRVHFADVL